MTKCGNCKIKYPDELLSPGMGLGTSDSMCGICALELSNKMLGINRTEFTGEIAEQMRLDAIEWRKKKGIK
jgi:hypothetical protein